MVYPRNIFVPTELLPPKILPWKKGIRRHTIRKDTHIIKQGMQKARNGRILNFVLTLLVLFLLSFSLLTKLKQTKLSLLPVHILSSFFNAWGKKNHFLLYKSSSHNSFWCKSLSYIFWRSYLKMLHTLRIGACLARLAPICFVRVTSQ